MLGLAGAGEVVILAWKDDELSCNAVMLQGAEPLLTLLDRHAKVVVGMENQGGSFDVARIFQRRCVPVLIEIVEQKSLEVVLVPVCAIARTVVADKIRNAAQRDSGLEAVRVSQNPIGHVAAVAAAGDSQAVPVDPRILLQHRI